MVSACWPQRRGFRRQGLPSFLHPAGFGGWRWSRRSLGRAEGEKADGFHGAEFLTQDGDSLAIEVDGAGVGRGAHGISAGGELERIENGDGQVSLSIPRLSA